MNTTPLCPWGAPSYLIFSENAYPLFYYAHFVPILAGGILVAVLLSHNPRSLAIRMLSALFAISAAWIFIDMLMTATNRPDAVVFLWSVVVLIEPLVYVAAFLFFFAFAYNKLPSFREQLLITALLAPLIIFAPTAYNIPGIYIEDCNADEGFIATHYSYAVEILMTIWILSLAITTIARTTDATERKKLTAFLIGIMAFLISFASGNLIGTFTGDWVTAQYGLFGLPIFMAFLGYIIVRFQAFNVKLLEAQALVVALALLVFSLLFVESLQWVFIIAGGTFILICGVGWSLIRSVRREIEQRQLIEVQEKELEAVNQQQEGLLHFVSHEVKGFLTEGQNAFAGIVEGDFGEVSEKIQSLAQTALGKMRNGVSTVMDILDASNMKKGTMQFKSEQFDFKRAVETVVQDLTPAADSKNVHIELSVHDGSYTVVGDAEKMQRHVIRNLVDNAIRYTPSGSIAISLEKLGTKIRFSVKDSGIGITPEDMQHLFTEGGHGKESIKTNVNSTGYGLFVAKTVTEAHKGRIWAESEGKGKGSRFVVEISVKA